MRWRRSCGPQDRNEEILGHKPFLVIADHLTRAGYAALRVDADRVGLVGHSQGGIVAPPAALAADGAATVTSQVAFLEAIAPWLQERFSNR